MASVFGNILNNALGAIKPISPINIDANSVTSNIRNIVDTQFNNIQTELKSSLTRFIPTEFVDAVSAINQLSIAQSGRNSTINQSSGGMSAVFNAKPNMLSDYANYTYHIRFSLTNDRNAYNVSNSNPQLTGTNKVIIAESGVTAGFNISSLKTTASATANGVQRNMWTNTKYELIIKEPRGLNLLDKMYLSALKLGVVNHLRCPYFIEIWFTGYDENGNIMGTELFHSINRVKVLKMDAVSDHVGTTYTLQLINDNAWAEMNAISIISANMSIAATTLGEFFTQLESNWNDMQDNINEDGIRRNNYKIELPNEWKSWTLRNPDVLKQNARNTPMTAELNGSQTTVTIPRGQSIENIVDFVVYLCQEAQNWIVGKNSPSPGAASLDTHGLIRYVTVYTNAEISNTAIQDPVTQDYMYDITYSLIPTETVKAYADMETVKKVQNITTKENKLQYLISNNRLSKKYEYIYTGHNTEVIKFDFNLANMWTIYQPTWIQSNSYDQYTQGALIDTNSISFQQIKNVLNRTKLLPNTLINMIDSAIPADVTTAFNNINNITSGIRTALLEEEQKLVSALNTNLAKITNNIVQINVPATSSDRTNLINNPLISVNLNVGDIVKNTIVDTEAALKINVNQNAQILSTRQQQLSALFAEDMGTATTSKRFPVVGQFDPIPTQQLARQNTDQNKIPNVSDPNTFSPGTGLVGSVIGNIYSGKAFLNVDLTIRGDPWWVSLGNLTQNNIVQAQLGNSTNTVINDAIGKLTSACFLRGDNEILLEFRTGVVINEDTGLAVTDENGADYFTGLYIVQQVENNFTRGKFTQLLKCRRDVLTDDLPPPGSPSTSRDRQDFTPKMVVTSRDRQDTALVPTTPTNNAAIPPASRDRQ